MGLIASFSVTEDLGYPAYTPQLGIPIDYSEGCDTFVSAWEENARDMVPVDTGHLKSTLEAYTDGDYCECSTLCDYAQYVEYGTIKMDAQPYFEPALSIALAEAQFEWTEALQEALDEEREEIEMMQQADGGFVGGGNIFGVILGAIIVGLFDLVMDIALGGDDYSTPKSAEELIGGSLIDRINVEII